MSEGNVDKLLQELSIEDIAGIEASLRQETENKREELRQMVGRRYRDVLEASNTVRRLTGIGNQLTALLADARHCASMGKNVARNGRNVKFKRETCRHLSLLHTLLSMTFTDADLLSRAFSLCIAENLQSKLSSDHFTGDSISTPHNGNHALLHLFSDQLIQCRIGLVDALNGALGAEADPKEVAALLAAYAMLKPQTGAVELLQLYLQARMDMIVASLPLPDSTLLDIIRHMKDTELCVEQTFGGGQTLFSTFQHVSQAGWCPASFQQFLDDQSLATSQLLEAEISRLNGICALNKLQMPERQDVQAACLGWIKRICSVSSERVRAMCAYFERVDQAVEFAVAISHIFKSDWSNMLSDSNALIYRQLFGDALFQRFHYLIEQELRHFERQLHQQLPQINCQPQPLFQKRGVTTVKFDPQLASCVSPELQELIQKMSGQLHQLQQNVQKYTLVGQEENVASLHNVLAEKVLAMVDRLTNFEEWQLPPPKEAQQSSSTFNDHAPMPPLPSSSSSIPSDADSRDQRTRWLSLFRLLLALVQHEPSVLCHCMNRNLDIIVRCNGTLHRATEQALCHFIDCVIDDCYNATFSCLRESNVESLMLKCCSNWQSWLDCAMESERVQLSETLQMQVPTQLSAHLFMFLSNICEELNQNSIGHLFTRNVTVHTSKRIGSLLSQLLLECADRCAPMPIILTQLLFDCKALFQMFQDKQFLDSAQKLEAKLDPVELSVLQEALARNAQLFVQRTSMLFGQLQAEPIAAFNKEGGQQHQSSYGALVDLMPNVVNVHRLTQIPRLSKLKEENQQSAAEEEEGRGGRKYNRKTPSLLGAADVTHGDDGVRRKGTAASSFTSLYDKISTGWFKS